MILAPETSTEYAGLELTLAVADINNTVTGAAGVIVLLQNTGNDPIDVTIPAELADNHGNKSDIVITLTAGQEKLFGPVPDRFLDAGDLPLEVTDGIAAELSIAAWTGTIPNSGLQYVGGA